MGLNENKAIVRKFYEAFGEGDDKAFDEVLADHVQAYSHGAKTPQDKRSHVAGIQRWNQAFSDSRYSIEDQVAEGDRVATRVTLRAVHDRGEFMGTAPTGKQITLDGMSVERIENGKIVERRVSFDSLALMQQLGIAPPNA